MFEARRKALLDQLPTFSAVLMQSAPLKMRNSDTEYPYRQESYFYYLTGIKQADVSILLIKTDQKSIFYIFCEDQNVNKARWIGPQINHHSARIKYGAEVVYALNEFDEKLPQLLCGLNKIYFFLDDMNLQQKMLDLPSVTLCELRSLLAPLRLIKSPEELNLMRKAACISAEAHVRAMIMCQPGSYEYELEAELLKTFYSQGSRYPAYTSIVAGGANACILHYVNNHDILKSGDLVLIDAGAEYDYYAADITRTFPVNGKFTKAQQAIYEIVLDAQLAGIACIKKGIAYDAIQNAVVKIIIQGLNSLNIINMSEKEAIETKVYQKYYMHKSGHWLGLDVHDVGVYQVDGKSVLLDVNQVLTVEPGLYFDPSDEAIPECYRGIGIRIEDDILVQEKGNEVLSCGVPKAISEIEKLMVHHGQSI